MNTAELKFDEKGLIPAIVQNEKNGDILMVAYMNEESLKLTLKEKCAWFYSRSRQKLWKKGEHSGSIMHISKMYFDCDKDTILLKVKPDGPACHTGQYSCFFYEVEEDELISIDTAPGKSVLEEITDTIDDRVKNPKEGSYTNYLFEKGIDKMCKKVGEESAEVIIAAKNRVKDEVVYEVADLMYHVSVVLREQNVEWQDIFDELKKRQK